jgi:hypothetical protein
MNLATPKTLVTLIGLCRVAEPYPGSTVTGAISGRFSLSPRGRSPELPVRLRAPAGTLCLRPDVRKR